MPRGADHRRLAARRLAIGTAAGVAVLAALLLVGAPWGLGVMGGWDTVSAIFLIWVWLSIGPMDKAQTALHAQAEDVSRSAADVTLLSASVASLIAVGYTLVEAGHKQGAEKDLLIAHTIGGVTLAWATVHTIFALRYAHLYYRSPVGGIDFHDDDQPDYRDLAYVALTIGMTFQVSDTDLQSKATRRTALRHALLSYVFGVVIIAITINLVATLLTK
jgi:uncharacterized membrane protein